MASASPHATNRAQTVGEDLAAVGTYVDVTTAQIAKAIRYDEAWLGRVSIDDVALLSEASARLENALARILSRKSIQLVAQVRELADLALRTERDGSATPDVDGRHRPLRLA